MTFQDLWIDGLPDLSQGEFRVSAEVEEGKIVAFREWVFLPETSGAFASHGRWLEGTDPTALVNACAEDPADAPCTQLFVDTVDDYVASR